MGNVIEFKKPEKKDSFNEVCKYSMFFELGAHCSGFGHLKKSANCLVWLLSPVIGLVKCMAVSKKHADLIAIYIEDIDGASNEVFEALIKNGPLMNFSAIEQGEDVIYVNLREEL